MQFLVTVNASSLSLLEFSVFQFYSEEYYLN